MTTAVSLWRRGGSVVEFAQRSTVGQGILAAACFALVALVLGWPVLLGRAALGPDRMLDFDPLYGSLHKLDEPIPTLDDPTPIALDWPRDLAIARGLRQGRIDLWNPLAACGTPLWAELGGPFFPLRVPFYLFPSRTSYEGFLLMRLAFAALGAYLLGRARGLTTVGAIAAGATFELCSFLIDQVRFGVYSNTFMLPWVLLGAEVLARRRSAPAAVGAAVLLGIGASAGHAGIALVLVAAFAVMMAMHAAALWRDSRAATSCLGWGGLALILGVALAAPTLLPTAELMTLATSYKFAPIGESARSALLARWRILLPVALFQPGFPSGLAVLGVLPVAAAMIGAVAGGVDVPLLAVGCLGLLIGATPPGLRWVNDLPLVHLILPLYALPLVAVPLTQAAGRGVDVLTAVPARLLAVAVAGPILASLALWLVCAPTQGLPLFVTLLPTPGPWVTPAVTALVATVAWALRRSRVAPLVATAVTVAMICERMVIAAPQLRHPTSEVLASPPSAAVAFLQQRLADGTARMVGVPHRVGYPVTTMLFGLPDVRGFAALPLRRYVEYLRAVDVAAPPEDPVQPSDMAASMVVHHVRVPRSALLDVAAARWVVVPRHGPGPPARLLDDDPDVQLALDHRQVLVYENQAALPRVRIVHTAVPVPDEDAARAWAQQTGARTGHARELDLEHTVVLEPDEHGRYPVLDPSDPAAREAAWITDQSDPDRLVIAAHLGSSGLVVIADSYMPGWRAWVDGMPTSIHPTNLLFRSVPVAAGRHTIELEYRPPGFTVGLVFWAVSAAACVLLLLAARRKRAAAPGWDERGP